MSELTMEQVHAQLDKELRDIAAQRAWSDHAKQVATAAAWTRAQDAAQALSEARVKAIADRRRTLERKAFGHPGNVDGQTALSRRDAADRAAMIEDPAEALTLLKRCGRSGDEHLAQAIAAHAMDYASTSVDANTPREKRWSTVVESYAAERPEVAEVLQEMSDLPLVDNDRRTSRGVQDRFAHAGHFLVPTPSSLSRMDEHKIRTLAASEPEVFGDSDVA